MDLQAPSRHTWHWVAIKTASTSLKGRSQWKKKLNKHSNKYDCVQTEVPYKTNWKQEGPVVGWELDQFYKGVRITNNFSCPQSPSSNSKETRSPMQPHPVLAPSQGALGCPGPTPSEGLSTDPLLFAKFRIACQPSFINSTFSVQGLELSRRLQCPGRPKKVLNLKKIAQLSQAPPESKCASFSLFLSNCSEQGALLCTIFSPICLAAEMT